MMGLILLSLALAAAAMGIMCWHDARYYRQQAIRMARINYWEPAKKLANASESARWKARNCAYITAACLLVIALRFWG